MIFMGSSFPDRGNLQGKHCRRIHIIKQRWYSVTESKLSAEVILRPCERVVSTKYCGEQFSEVLVVVG